MTMTEPHSATVKLALVVEGAEYPLAQVGPGFLVFKPEAMLSKLTNEGELLIVIDGKEERTLR